MSALRNYRYSWWLHWRELADYVLPRRYKWLILANQFNRGSAINNNIIDSTATLAARVLANGMMSGVTPPTRPWFKLKIEGYADDAAVALWLAEVEKRMLRVFQESNFYTAAATMWFDLVVFGTAVVIIYQDFENVIHCFNPCAGEYFLGCDDKFMVNRIGREFVMTNSQLLTKFDFSNLPSDVQQAKPGTTTSGSLGQQERLIWHMIEPNNDNYDVVPRAFKWREVYWMAGNNSSPQGGGSPPNSVLDAKGFHDWPAMTPRWDVVSNDPYGRSPAMDALGDTKQLQQETRRKAQAIDKMVNPPLIADVQLKNQPMSLLPGGVTYVAGLNTGREGAKPIFQIMPPIGEMKQDIQEIQQRIKITFHNDLFTGISDLTTVRTATEIDARREEKIVLLGPVLERSIQEGLAKAIDRTFNIMLRGQLLPPLPRSLASGPQHIQTDYISMLSIAQRGLATASIEKVWAFAGQIAGAKPDILDNMDEDDTIHEYGEALSVSPKIFKGNAERDQIRNQRNQQAQEQQGMQQAQAAVDAAKNLGATDVGGGANALQVMLGNQQQPTQGQP